MAAREDVFANGGDSGERMRAIDWSKTPLGDVHLWPNSLKTCTRIILASRQPMFVCWGEQLITLYNDAYRAILGRKHPEALGQPASVVWRESWDQVGPRAEATMRGTSGTYDEALLFILDRHGQEQETYFTPWYSPVPDDQGRTAGILCSNTDETQRVLGGRQLATLQELAAKTAHKKTWREVCACAVDALGANAHDLPFALLYVEQPDKRRMVLAGASRMVPGAALGAPTLSLDDGAHLPFEEVLRARRTRVVSDVSHLGPLPCGAWPRAPRELALVPIPASGECGGVLVVGLSPFRRFDAGYSGFLDLVAGQIAGAISSVRAYEEKNLHVAGLLEASAQAEADLRSMLLQAPVPIAVVRGEELVFELANARYLDVVGKGDIVGKSVFEVLPEVRAQGLDELLHRVLRSGKPQVGEEKLLPIEINGVRTETYWTFICAPLVNRAGVVDRVMAVCQDVTAQVLGRRRMTEALKDKERLHAALAAVAVGTYSWDLKTDVVERDAGVQLVFDLEPEEGEKIDDYTKRIHADDREAWLQDLTRCKREGVGFEAQYRVTCSDGTTRWVRDKARVVRDDAGAPLRIAGAVVDVTEVKQLQQREETARVCAEEASRAKDEFLATLSHELRTPLNAILGWASILRSGHWSADGLEKALATIERNAKTQARLIDDMLDVSRIISGKLRLDLRRVDITEVVRGAVDVIRPAADAKGVTLAVRAHVGSEGLVGDPDRLQQVVWNLLSNAVRFTRSGGAVEVMTENVDGTMRITVRDSGAGIAPDDLPHVFERFRQIDSSTTRKHGGLGLGLAIVRHLIELHGGTVIAESAGLGHGATFAISLPARAPDMRPVLDAASTRELEPASSRMSPASQLSGMRVLVVDDDHDSLELVTSILEEAGAVVVTADSVRVALQAFERSRPDLLISDIAMPDVDGDTFIRRIRAMHSDDGGDVPAIALTAYTRQEDRERALASGFQCHLGKPIDVGALVTTAARLGRRRRR